MTTTSNSQKPPKALTPRQLRTLDVLFSLGTERPYSTEGLASKLHDTILQKTQNIGSLWTEKKFFLSKSQFLSVNRCEEAFVYEASRPREFSDSARAAMAAGSVAHRAIQISNTHPDRPVNEYIRLAVAGCRSADQDLDEWWSQQDTSIHSDILTNASSKVTNFLDDFPPLDARWAPRFEEPLGTTIGSVKVSSRADLIIGRPRGDFKQTMMLIDLKSGAVRDEHLLEAHFYALIATLRYGVAPWRSLVYSLSSGEYTDPDINEDVLFEVANQFALAANTIVGLLTEKQEATYGPGDHCRFCPLVSSCPQAQIK